MSAQKEFSLTRSQFAETQGITRENLKQRMRRGLYKNDYIFENGQYYFKSQEGVRENKGLYPGRIVPRKIKRKIRRGAHYKGKYPNKAFELHNLKKMLDKVNETDPDFINNYHKLKEIHQREKQKKLRENIRQTHKRNLGGLYNAKNPTYTSYKPIRQYDDPEGHTINPRPKDEYERYLEETQGETPSPTGKYYW